jgi:GT2 family glycosyltransferase
MKASIIVCTRDRCHKLAQTLERMSMIHVPDGVECELVIIDNGSSDATREVCRSAGRHSHIPIRYVFEGTAGKSVALNRALKEASGDILLFTDDDCLPSEGWLDRTIREFAEDEGLGVLGGRVEGWGEEQVELTLRSESERRVVQSAFEFYPEPPIIGANMAVRRQVFENVGGYDTLMGPGARTGAVAEDVDMAYRAFRLGYKVLYSPDAVVFHHHGRSSEQEIERTMRGYHRGRGAFYAKHFFQDREVALMALRNVAGSVGAIFSGWRRGELAGGEIWFLRALTSGAASRIIGKKPIERSERPKQKTLPYRN